MGGERSYDDGSRWILSSGGQTNCGKDISAFWVWQGVMFISGRIPGGGRSVDHQIIYS